MNSSFKIGVDGGGTKTECILIDESGSIIAVHVGVGCNPSVVGPEQARTIALAALDSLRARALSQAATAAPWGPGAMIESTMLCMAGSRSFWQSFAADLTGFGKVTTFDDSLPVLELATHGKPGIAIHGGTGSFVAARAEDGTLHYAGGHGWRFGDAGSGYDVGRRIVSRALLEAQGCADPSAVGELVREHIQVGPDTDASTIAHYFYHHKEPNRDIAGLAPAVLQLMDEGDPVAREIVINSAIELLQLATQVAVRLFPDSVETVRAGLSGPILTHPAVAAVLMANSQLSLIPVEEKPIEGVRRLLTSA
ncbi:MAG TPA: BadF/BadG/BcrA/BcrD ATPase family protein [Opitutaceae bacterium]|nr:BadF/BadG/BcrA/BcrD ATPase family protein [Opitutaceae bacterium]